MRRKTRANIHNYEFHSEKTGGGGGHWEACAVTGRNCTYSDVLYDILTCDGTKIKLQSTERAAHVPWVVADVTHPQKAANSELQSRERSNRHTGPAQIWYGQNTQRGTKMVAGVK